MPSQVRLCLSCSALRQKKIFHPSAGLRDEVPEKFSGTCSARAGGHQQGWKFKHAEIILLHLLDMTQNLHITTQPPLSKDSSPNVLFGFDHKDS